MRNSSIKKTLKYTYYLLCALIFSALAVLEYLSHYRAGVMRHLYIKKMNYLTTIYTPKNIIIHIGIITIIGIALYLICKMENIKFRVAKYIVYIIVLFTIFYSGIFKGMYTYPYIIMVMEFMVLVFIIVKISEIINKRLSNK